MLFYKWEIFVILNLPQLSIVHYTLTSGAFGFHCGGGSLSHYKAVVHALSAHKLGVSADFGYLAFIKHYKPVGAAEGGKAVGYGYGGSSLYKAVQGGLYLLFGLGVKAGCCLVQNQHAGVA